MYRAWILLPLGVHVVDIVGIGPAQKVVFCGESANRVALGEEGLLAVSGEAAACGE